MSKCKRLHVSSRGSPIGYYFALNCRLILMGEKRKSAFSSFRQAETGRLDRSSIHVTVTASWLLTRLFIWGSGHHFGSLLRSACTQPHKKMTQEPPLTSAGWSLNQLVTRGPRFREIPRVSVSDQNLEATIHQHETSGVPLVIEGMHEHETWPTATFDLQWLQDNSKLREPGN